MNKFIGLLVLATSIAGNVFAQNKVQLTNTDKTFEVPADRIIRRFTVDLGKGNKMQVELTAMEDIDQLKNADSLVKVFLHDIEPLKDSLSDELLPKRIDYAIDSSGRKKIRILHYQPKGSSFLVTQGDIAVLKLEQDTVNIITTFQGNIQSILSKKEKYLHYCRISFFVNQLAELPAYLDGKLNEKINLIANNKRNDWSGDGDEQFRLDKDHTITAKQPQGYISGAGDYLNLNASVNLQNYKNYFVPSFNIGANVFAMIGHFKYEVGFAWEPHFFFGKNNAGNLQTFRNDFITLTLGRKPTIERDINGPHFNLFQTLTVGYLIRQKGDYFDNHTFRIGTGGVNLKGNKLRLEPVFYFHDLFKNVTPGLRLSMNF
jgi:hypothetical protein